MRKQRRTFSEDFKRAAVRLVTQEGHGLAQVARDLDLDRKMLRRWRQEVERDAEEAFPGPGHQKAELERVRRLERELARVKQEREILKKALAIFSVTGESLP